MDESTDTTTAGDGITALRRQRHAELETVLFRHGFEIVHNPSGAIYVRVCTGDVAAEPLMLDYKRDVANFVHHGFGTAHDVAMHFVHRFAFRTRSWVTPPDA